ncbi:MAG: hypothetical protein SGPRY_013401, partial [Prymnesium sp.]
MLLPLPLPAAAAVGIALGLALYCVVVRRQRSAQEYARVQLYEAADRPLDYCGTPLLSQSSHRDLSFDPADREGLEWAAAREGGVTDDTTGFGWESHRVEGLDVDDVEAVQQQIKAELN